MVRGEGMLFHRSREVAAGLSGSGAHIKESWEMPPEEKGCVSYREFCISGRSI